MKKLLIVLFISFFMITNIFADTYNTIKGFDSEGYTRRE